MQVELEKMLNGVFEHLQQEEGRRQESRRHIKLLADKQHLSSKVDAHHVKIQTLIQQIAALDNAGATAGGDARGGERNVGIVGLEDEEDEDGSAPTVAHAPRQQAARQQILDSDSDDGAPITPGKHPPSCTTGPSWCGWIRKFVRAV